MIVIGLITLIKRVKYVILHAKPVLIHLKPVVSYAKILLLNYLIIT